ncbi:MAG: AlpA family phage regulatory protein [Pseudomonadota bacterium]
MSASTNQTEDPPITLPTSSALDPYGRFLKLADVVASIGVSQAMVYKMINDERAQFPKPVKVGRASLWIERDIVAWKAKIVGDR